ncbi:MAG: hypothetical protein J6332_09400, partial [Abditibacteriota bacterium]|nr:hypothetical protein [Abditibacteriota bacterium]
FSRHIRAAAPGNPVPNARYIIPHSEPSVNPFFGKNRKILNDFSAVYIAPKTSALGATNKIIPHHAGDFNPFSEKSRTFFEISLNRFRKSIPGPYRDCFTETANRRREKLKVFPAPKKEPIRTLSQPFYGTGKTNAEKA